MPHSLSDLQREYLDFIREYIHKNESSPRLDEIAGNFGVKAPTAHKVLKALQSKGYLYFGRDPVSGFFIRLIERAGTAEVMIEVPIAGKVTAMGEVIDFPQEIGHFASVFIGANPGDVFALLVTEDIPQASILTGDLILFDQKKKTQPGDICIGPIGMRLFLLKVDSKTMDREMLTFETAMAYPIPESLTHPELGQLLNWYPLVFDTKNEDWFTKLAENENFPIAPLKPEWILATAMRLTRPLAF